MASDPKGINFHPAQQHEGATNGANFTTDQALVDNRISHSVSKQSFKRETSGARLERAASNPDFVTVNASADISRQQLHNYHPLNSSKQQLMQQERSRESLKRQGSLEGIQRGRSLENKSNHSRSSNKRSQSQLEKSKSQRSISGHKSQKSQKSHRSSLTENPMQYENSMVHKNAGFTDAESKQYREFDQSGRNQQTFSQRAAMAGIKNLQSTTYKQDGPIKAVIDRFPEKFVVSSGNSSNHNAGNHNPNGGPDHPTNSMSKTSARHSSYQQLQRGNADNNHSSNSNA